MSWVVLPKNRISIEALLVALINATVITVFCLGGRRGRATRPVARPADDPQGRLPGGRFADHWLVRVLGEWLSEPNPASDTDRLILFKDV